MWSPLPEGATLVDLHDGYDPAVFHAFYDEVLRPSLPPAELEDEPVLETRIREGGSRQTLASVVVSADGSVGGGVVCEWYTGSRCLLLGYLAVRRHLRGQGVGTALVRNVVSGRWTDRDPELVLGEIDDPRIAAPDADGDPFARLRFFDRLSARLLRMPYLQPEVRTGAGRVRMLLIALHIAPRALVADETAVDDKTVRAFLEEYFADAEGSAAVDDPVLAALSEWTTNGIALLPLDRFEDIPSSAWELSAGPG